MQTFDRHNALVRSETRKKILKEEFEPNPTFM